MLLNDASRQIRGSAAAVIQKPTAVSKALGINHRVPSPEFQMLPASVVVGLKLYRVIVLRLNRFAKSHVVITDQLAQI
jgi:hypothetical protein